MIGPLEPSAVRKLLFVTWDGPDLTYLESLFLPIFRELRTFGVATDVLQFRWGEADKTRAVRDACEAEGSRYRSVAVWRLGGAGAFASAFLGARAIRAAARAFGSEAVMPRSLMPAIATLRAGIHRDLPVVFDADGLPADERAEYAGLSTTGATYRLLRDVEAQMIRRATAVITRSAAANNVLLARAGPHVPAERFHVVANGRDEAAFTPGTPEARTAARLGLGIAPDAPLLVYVGSIGSQYRFDQIAGTAAALRARRPDARLLLVCTDPQRALAKVGTIESAAADMAVAISARPHEVSALLAAGDAGLAYRATGFANRAVAPIKLSEYLLCGLPVVGTGSIGDTHAAVAAGVFADQADPAQAADWLVGSVLPMREAMRAAARQVGIDGFSLRRSVEDYRKALSHVGF